MLTCRLAEEDFVSVMTDPDLPRVEIHGKWGRSFV